MKEKTLCPTWDQTLIFEEVDIYEPVESVSQSPPTVVVELFDKDPIVSVIGSHVQLGTLGTVTVCDNAPTKVVTVWSWHCGEPALYILPNQC